MPAESLFVHAYSTHFASRNISSELKIIVIWLAKKSPHSRIKHMRKMELAMDASRAFAPSLNVEI